MAVRPEGKKSGQDWLLQLLDPDQAVAHEARLFLGGMQETDAWMLPDLVEGTHSQSPYVRFWAMCGIKRLGGASRTEAERIVQLLQDPYPAVRAMATSTLWDVTEPSQGLQHLIAVSTSDPDDDPRRAATRHLGRCPPALRGEAINALIPLLEDPVVPAEAATGIKVHLLAVHSLPSKVDQVVLVKALDRAMACGDEHSGLQAKAGLARALLLSPEVGG